MLPPAVWAQHLSKLAKQQHVLAAQIRQRAHPELVEQ